MKRVFDRENEACLCRELGSCEIVEKENDYPKGSLG